MKESVYKSYAELPLFLNAETVAKVLGVSPSSGYELIHEPDFPALRIGNRRPLHRTAEPVPALLPKTLGAVHRVGAKHRP